MCVLGGTGFLGRRLASRLARGQWLVRIPTRGSIPPPELRVLPTVEVLRADIHDPDRLDELVAGCDAVVNLVGILNESGRDGSGFRRAHVELTRKALAACQSNAVGDFIQISAIAADARSAPSHYLRSKGEAEELIVAAGDNPAWTILQPSVIFGPGDSFLNRFAGLLRTVPLLFPLARADALFGPVHVDDVAQAIEVALNDTATRGQRYELCGPDVYSLRELVALTARALGLRRRIIGLPDALARLQANIMEWLPGKPFSMDNYRSLTVPSVCTRNGLAALGITARSLEVNLAECLGSPRASVHLDNWRRQAGR